MSKVYQKGASIITKREGKKSSVSVGDVREIFKELVEQQVECLVAEVSPQGILEQLFDEAISKYHKMAAKAEANFLKKLKKKKAKKK